MIFVWSTGIIRHSMKGQFPSISCNLFLEQIQEWKLEKNKYFE
jgi:hypothetical protein